MNFKIALIGLCLVLNGASALADVVVPEAVLGHYSKQSGMRMFVNKAACKSMKGEYQKENGSCIIYSEGGNSVSISKYGFNEDFYIVHVETQYGAMHMNLFEGVVTGINGGEITAEEVTYDSGITPIKKGCMLKVLIEGGYASVSPLEPFCEAGLHIEGAKKRR